MSLYRISNTVCFDTKLWTLKCHSPEEAEHRFKASLSYILSDWRQYKVSNLTIPATVSEAARLLRGFTVKELDRSINAIV